MATRGILAHGTDRQHLPLNRPAPGAGSVGALGLRDQSTPHTSRGTVFQPRWCQGTARQWIARGQEPFGLLNDAAFIPYRQDRRYLEILQPGLFAFDSVYLALP